MTPFDPEAAAHAMVSNRVAVAHSCWLRWGANERLEGCPIGALYFAAHGVVADAAKIIAWANALAESADYVAGFDDGFHGFAPSKPHTADYASGLRDGQSTRVIVEGDGARHSTPRLFRPVESSERTKRSRS